MKNVIPPASADKNTKDPTTAPAVVELFVADAIMIGIMAGDIVFDADLLSERLSLRDFDWEGDTLGVGVFVGESVYEGVCEGDLLVDFDFEGLPDTLFEDDTVSDSERVYERATLGVFEAERVAERDFDSERLRVLLADSERDIEYVAVSDFDSERLSEGDFVSERVTDPDFDS